MILKTKISLSKTRTKEFYIENSGFCSISFYFLNKNLLYNKCHRKNGPAIIRESYIHWYHKGLTHRIDGPSHISTYPIDTKIFYFKGISYSEQEYWNI